MHFFVTMMLNESSIILKGLALCLLGLRTGLYDLPDLGIVINRNI